MKKLLFAVVLLALLFPARLLACSCDGPIHFCETMSFSAPLTVLAVKTAVVDHGMRVQVLDVLRGTATGSGQEIIIWGDNGFLCRHYAATWAVGDTVVFNLGRIGAYPALPQEDSLDYTISSCGVQYLNYAGGKVTGAINGVDVEMDYGVFGAAMVLTCAGISAVPDVMQPHLAVFPNPAHAEVYFSLSGFRTGDVQVRLFATDGSMVMDENNMPFTEGGMLHLSTFALPRGIYLAEVRSATDVLRTKLVLE